VLTNREGRPWVMRRRTQGEMDALVREAGFTKRQMRIDEHGSSRSASRSATRRSPSGRAGPQA
jgi:hypothetical protein